MDQRASKPLIGYQMIAAVTGDGSSGSLGWGQLYTYVFGRDGVFVRGERPRLSCQFQIGHSETIRGLAEVDEFFTFEPARIPAVLVGEMFTRARQEALRDTEILFHFVEGAAGEGVALSSSFDGWTLAVPLQNKTRTSCRPHYSGPDSSHSRALIEVHSHHNMPAYFSAGDDKDEQGFRIYAVIGCVLEAPTIRVRVGLHGYFWDINPSWVFELPRNVIGEGSTDEVAYEQYEV